MGGFGFTGLAVGIGALIAAAAGAVGKGGGKWRYQRARPSQLADDLDPVIPNPSHSSYPSGHAAQTYALALALGELKQADKNAYIQRAFNIARRREIAGVHFSSDSLAGFSLAEFVFSKLKNTQEYQTLIQQARKEFSNDQ